VRKNGYRRIAIRKKKEKLCHSVGRKVIPGWSEDQTGAERQKEFYKIHANSAVGDPQRGDKGSKEQSRR